MGFRNPIAAGVNLIRAALRSPNYVPGVSGWTINKDGTAEFANSIIRGILDVVGSSGARISVVPATQPTIFFFSPDGTNYGFINLYNGTGSQAQLGINSGTFTPADTILRYSRYFAADDNFSLSIARASSPGNQTTFGGYLQQSSTGSYIGWRDTLNNQYMLAHFVQGGIYLTQDSGDPVPVFVNNQRLARGMLINRKTTFAQGQVTAETKDTGIGDPTFTAYAGESYTFEYVARGEPAVGAVLAEFLIRYSWDGTASPPDTTTSSPLVQAQPVYFAGSGGGYQVGVSVRVTLYCATSGSDLVPGVYKVGAFRRRTGGGAGSTISVGQITGGWRGLSVMASGGTP